MVINKVNKGQGLLNLEFMKFLEQGFLGDFLFLVSVVRVVDIGFFCENSKEKYFSFLRYRFVIFSFAFYIL